MRLNSLLAISISTALIFSISACRKESPPAPNIIFILVDDLGWTDLGCYGSQFYETPHIDQLASESILFTNAYASASICSPSRASILTGKHPARLNITDWIPGNDPKDRKLLGPEDFHSLPVNEKTVAEILKDHGYHTFFSGKWHLGGKGSLPGEHGFDVNIGGYEAGSPRGGYYVPYKNPYLTDGPDGEYLTDRLTSESLQFIRTQDGSPFFLFLSYYTVHTPIQPCKRHIDEFSMKAEQLPGKGEVKIKDEGEGSTVLNQYNPEYASMVHAMDENIGKIIDLLVEMDILENTVIFFTSDNGGLSTLRSRNKRMAPTSVLPLRAGKGWLYEGGIRVPLLVKPAGHREKFTAFSCDVPVAGTDFFPTILEMAGIPEKAELTDGVSLIPLVSRSGSLEREDIFWHYPHYHGSGWKPGSAIRSGNWKLIEFHETGKVELYDLKQDIGEQNDLYRVYPDTAGILLDRLRSWQRTTGAKFATVNPDYKQE
jgi:arylsulfatase A-like enzyme